MDLPKDVMHLTELRRYWGFPRIKIAAIFWRLAFLSLLSFSAFERANGEGVVACPVVTPSMGIFSGDKIHKDSIIAIEKGDDGHQINLSLYEKEGEDCRKSIFAKYSVEGGDPNVDSIFSSN